MLFFLRSLYLDAKLECLWHSHVDRKIHKHVHTHARRVQLGAFFVFCGCVFLARLGHYGAGVFLQIICVCVDVGVLLLLLALAFYILFTNCHHYRDYHHTTKITFIKGMTG